jgi:glutaredoxin 3
MSQKSVEIYTWRTCPYCLRAKSLLDSKGVRYTEYSIDGDQEAQARMSERAHGRRSVPQIFVDKSQHIGGCDDLYRLEAEGKLDEILGR